MSTTNELVALPAFPTVTADDTVIHHNNTVFVHHDTREFTRVTIVGDDEPRVGGVVEYTTTRPRVTPADTVITVGSVTRIQHGPGRETRVLPAP